MNKTMRNLSLFTATLNCESYVVLLGSFYQKCIQNHPKMNKDKKARTKVEIQMSICPDKKAAQGTPCTKSDQLAS